MTVHKCIQCNRPLEPGTSSLCTQCVNEALELFEEYERTGIDPYPDGDDDAYAAEYVREYFEKRSYESEPDEMTEDCGYDLETGICDLDGTEECMFSCPFRQAIKAERRATL